MKKITKFFAAKWEWAQRNPLFWANILLAAISYYIATQKGTTDFRIRFWAMFLQVLGAWIVWRDLVSTARGFGRANILGRNWRWLKDGLGFPTPVQGHANIILGNIGMAAAGTLRAHISNSATVEQRITELEAYIRRVDDAVVEATLLIHQRSASYQKKFRIVNLKQKRLSNKPKIDLVMLPQEIIQNLFSAPFGC